MKTLASTKHGPVIQLLSLGIGLRPPRELEGSLRQVALHRLVVLARLAHVLAQHLADEARHAQAALRRVHARPRGGFPVEGDGDVLHRVACQAMSMGRHITLVSCIYGSSDPRYAAIATMSSM